MIKLAGLFLGAALLVSFGATAEEQIRQVLTDQTAAWNRGDIAAFATTYVNSPDLVFIGKSVSRGYSQMLERYRQNYPTPEKMGKLRFSDLEIKVLDAKYANVLGRFHLERMAEAGGNADGVFTLLFTKTAQGWKIIQDHTS